MMNSKPGEPPLKEGSRVDSATMPALMLSLSTQHAVSEGLSAPLGSSKAPSSEAITALMPSLGRAEDALIALESSGTVGFRSMDTVGWELEKAQEIAAKLREDTDVLLVAGIGGSALGASALDAALGATCDDPHRVVVLDSVDPFHVARTLEGLDPSRTAIAVISKSGGTIETAALFRILLPWVRRGAGSEWARRLVLVTDRVRGALRPLVDAWGVASLPVPDDVGGRFSVLTAVGILPAAYRGLDVTSLIEGARAMSEVVRVRSVEDNPAWAFAAVHDVWWPRATVSVLLTYSERLALLGAWFMQLWGESLGKPLPQGGAYGWTPSCARGPADQHSQLQLWQEGPADRIVTVVRVEDHGEEVLVPALEGPEDGVAPYLSTVSLSDLLDAERRGTSAALVSAGRPVLSLTLPRIDAHVIGQLVMFLETATAITGLLRGINPFDQPGVEAGKQYAYGLLGREGFGDRAAEVDKLIGAK